MSRQLQNEPYDKETACGPGLLEYGMKAEIPTHRMILNKARLYVRHFFGTLLDFAGLPGFVRECNYGGPTAKAQITVRHGCLFTIISVNGIDIFFHRLTGSIEAVGVPSCRKPDPLPESETFLTLTETPHRDAQEHSALVGASQSVAD